MMAFCLGSNPQLSGNCQVCLTHCKRGCLPPPFSLLLSCSLTLFTLFPLHPFPSPLSPCDHGWSLLLFYSSTLSLLFSYLLFSSPPPPLCFSLNSPPHTLNWLYYTLYCLVAGPSGGRDAASWVHGGTPFPHT